jgi:aspartate ammonia-lyase
MPGKVNPVLPELVIQVSFQLIGSAQTVGLATASGELQIAAMGPIAAAELLNGLQRLSEVAFLFAAKCIEGLTWDRDRVQLNLTRGSFETAVRAIADAGYENVANSCRP